MTLPATDTEVLYPSGATRCDAAVLHVEPVRQDQGAAERLVVLLDRTAVHAVDAVWPDQGADRGALVQTDGTRIELLDAQVAAWEGEHGPLLLGADIPVRTGTAGWTFGVAHIVAADSSIAEGDVVHVEVDAGFRRALSVGHTACHLASLALDRALAGSWSKEVRTDALGAPAFDAEAIEESRILEHGSRDEYRIGKSLRKKGFDPSAFDDPDAVAAAVDAVLAEWIATGAPVRVDAPDPRLSARRTWVCELPEGEARIPCGGTHLDSLAELTRVAVRFDVEDVPGARSVTMHTTATAQ